MVINMLNKVSVQLSKFLLQKIKEDKQEQDVYTYGFELIISTIIFFVSIIVISAILSSPISGLVFLITFVPLRLFTGGYHADTYSRCFILTRLYNFINDTLASEALVLRHSSLHLILCGFRYFSRK